MPRRTAARRQPQPNLVLDINAPSQVRTYHQYLVRLMEYKTGGTFPNDRTFTSDELATLQPDNVYGWMCTKAYGKPNPV